MVTFLCSAVALATLVQAPTPPPPNDSIAELRSRAERDSTDARLWLLMGRAYLELGADAHGATHRSSEDSTWVRAVVDTAETRSEEHTSELQSRLHLVCRLLLEKKKMRH